MDNKSFFFRLSFCILFFICITAEIVPRSYNTRGHHQQTIQNTLQNQYRAWSNVDGKEFYTGKMKERIETIKRTFMPDQAEPIQEHEVIENERDIDKDESPEDPQVNNMNWKDHLSRATDAIMNNPIIKNHWEALKNTEIPPVLTQEIKDITSSMKELQITPEMKESIKMQLENGLSTVSEGIKDLSNSLETMAINLGRQIFEMEETTKKAFDSAMKQFSSCPDQDLEVKPEMPNQSQQNSEEDKPMSNCIKTLLQSGDLKLIPDEKNDFSISCTNDDCKKCLLWIYLNSKKGNEV